MSGESKQRTRNPSNLRTDIFVRQKIRGAAHRILFRDLARLASPRKTEQFLAAKTGSDPRTARRWLRGDRAPAGAVYAVLADIFSRID
jgi:hypothetical protein